MIMYFFQTPWSFNNDYVLFPNTLISPLLFHHSRQIELNLDLPSPVSGFAAVGLGNGKFMITTRSLNLTINDPKLDHKNATWAPNSIQVSAFAFGIGYTDNISGCLSEHTYGRQQQVWLEVPAQTTGTTLHDNNDNHLKASSSWSVPGSLCPHCERTRFCEKQ